MPGLKPRPTRKPTVRLRLRQCEHGQYAALRAVLVQVAERADGAQSGRRILDAQLGGHTDAGPASHTRQNGDVLLAVRAHVRHRVADDARRRLELPELLARLRVHGLQPAFHRPVEDDVAAGGQCSAPVRQTFLDAPDLLAGRRIPGDELAAIPSGPRLADDDSADVRLAGLILHFHALVV